MSSPARRMQPRHSGKSIGSASPAHGSRPMGFGPAEGILRAGCDGLIVAERIVPEPPGRLGLH